MPDDYSKFTAPRADEELYEGVPAPATFGIDPTDGLPSTTPASNDDRPPSLSEDTLVCMADKRSFVVRNSDGSVFVSIPPENVQRLPNGEYFVEIAVLMALSTKVSSVDDYRLGELAIGTALGEPSGKIRNVIRVEPVRPQCRHYLRMQTDTSADRERRFLARSCMAQQSDTGEYYSLRDTLVSACSIREPRHLESELLLDQFDEEKIRQGREQAALGQFDIDEELEAEAKRDRGLGILG
jgi:hypothetical protein